MERVLCGNYEENEKERRAEDVETAKAEVEKNSKDELRKTLKSMKNGEAVSPETHRRGMGRESSGVFQME